MGLAVSDPLGITAQGLPTLERRGEENDLRAIGSVIEEWEVGSIVIGLPRRLDGSLGKQAERVRRFAGRLGEATGLRVDTWDERWTTVAAERVLIEGKVRRRRRKPLRDRLAAVLILQGYLDRRRSAGRKEGA